MKGNEKLKFFPGSFFRKFKKKGIKVQILICFLLIILLNTKTIQSLVQESRTFFITINVYCYQAINCIIKKTDQILYILSHDIDDALLKLYKENMKLKTDLKSISYLQSENKELRDLLHMKLYPGYTIIVGKIVSTFSNDYTCSYILDVGNLDGIYTDDVVITNDGLVGRISEINEKWSRVLLITDTNSNVPVKIGKNQINAIVSGNNSSFLKISMKHEDMNINDGDLVETSGFGNIFCDKIPVGKVMKDGKDFFVLPIVNFNLVKFVCVLRKNR